MKKIVISDIKGAIFDMDGVLLDSMPMWDHAGEMYLAGRGYRQNLILRRCFSP
ncbi:MAG: hypothetical protein ACLS5W_12635 [Coprococcus sp.]